MDRDQALRLYRAFFTIKERVALALFQLESSTEADRDAALANLENALSLAAESAQEMLKVIPPAEDDV